MKTLKKIVLARNLANGEMGKLKAGNMSNVNDATPCSCEGSTQGNFWCNDNSNKVSGCSCYGTGDNSNTGKGCTCK